MERDIKNFDRSIERMVNEQEVAPPFGAWNRIAAELDAMPVGESAPSSGALIPKRGLTGIIAGAIILGVAISATYLLSHSSVKDNTTALVHESQKTEIAVPVPVYTQPVTEPESVVNAENTKPSLIAKTHHQQRLVAPIAKKTAIPVNPIASASPASNLNADVPCAIQSVKSITNYELAQTYYFPPIDRTTAENGVPEKAVATNSNGKDDKKIGDDDNDDSDKKVKSSEQKIKFKHHKRPKFNYGRLNKL